MLTRVRWIKFFGWALAIAANILLMQMRNWPDASFDRSYLTYQDRVDIPLYLLAFAGYLHCMAFFTAVLFQFEKLGVLYRTIFEMLFTDVKR